VKKKTRLQYEVREHYNDWYNDLTFESNKQYLAVYPDIFYVGQEYYWRLSDSSFDSEGKFLSGTKVMSNVKTSNEPKLDKKLFQICASGSLR